MSEKDEKKKEKKKKALSLTEALKAINKHYGKGTILPADQATGLVMDRLPSGIFSFDMVIGGGYPRGRITMLKGGYSTGKSAMCLKAVAEAQRTCRWCNEQFERINFLGEVIERDCKCGKRTPYNPIWLDAEHAFSSAWAAKWGIDPSKLMVIQTEYAEQAIDITDLCIRSKEADIVVIDSIAALTPGVEVEKSSTEWQMGVKARLMSKALRKWTSGLNSFGLLAETKCTILLVNQMSMSIGKISYMTSPGGMALDFYESIDVQFKKNKFIEEPGTKRPIGVEVETIVKKNKTAPPAAPGSTFGLYFVPSPGVYGIGDTDTDLQVLNSAIYWGLVEKGGAWYTVGEKRVQGKPAATKVLREDPNLLEELMEEVKARELHWMETGEPPPSKEKEEDAEE
jgi:recombination protein RecA